ncbi:hypothetical protein Tco_1572859 [Tanacetum coccineum]
MKAASYPDFGLELLKFYIDRHDSPPHRKDVRTHMRILSVIRIKAYSRYGSSRSSSWFKQTDAIYCCQTMDSKLGDSTAVFLINNNEQKIMRFNEIYKFSDGTLTRILEALDYRVKDFHIKRLNPGMNTRFWTQKDVTRSKEFMSAIERRLKTKRIYWNLECFVGGRVHDIDYRLLQRKE